MTLHKSRSFLKITNTFYEKIIIQKHKLFLKIETYKFSFMLCKAIIHKIIILCYILIIKFLPNSP